MSRLNKLREFDYQCHMSMRLLRSIFIVIGLVILIAIPKFIFMELTEIPSDMVLNRPDDLQCSIYSIMRFKWICIRGGGLMAHLWLYPMAISAWLLCAAILSWNLRSRQERFGQSLRVCILLAIGGVTGFAAGYRLFYFFQGYVNHIYTQHSLLLLAVAVVSWLWLRLTPPWSETVRIEKRRRIEEPARQRELARTLEIEIEERLADKNSRKNKRG